MGKFTMFAVGLLGLIVLGVAVGLIGAGSVDVFKSEERRAAEARIVEERARAEAERVRAEAARADREEIATEAQRRAAPALVLRDALTWAGVGVGALVLCVGLAFGVVAWVNKRATAVYPNGAGLYPVIVRRSWGGSIVMHDPNKTISAGSVYQVPGLFERLTWSVATMRGYNVSLPGVVAVYPACGPDADMLQVATQAQAVQGLAAVHRWPKLPQVIGRNVSLNGDGGTPLLDDKEQGAGMAVAWPSHVPLAGLLASGRPSLDNLVIGVTVGEDGRQETVKAAFRELVHVAVGGSSGWGKSKFLQALAYQVAASEQADMVLVDLEGVTFSLFGRCAYLLYPVADDEQKALAVLQALAGELEKRKAAFGQYPGVESLDDYNKVAGDSLRPIVALVDESTALMGNGTIESAAGGLVLRSRKYGLWFVLGGQDWKATSLDTKIRNQLSTRVQFRALSASQSRVLLEQGGAENLDVPGRALAVLPGRGLVRIQAPFVSKGEIGALPVGGPEFGIPMTGAGGLAVTELDDETRRVVELAGHGLSRSEIARQVYGSAGGAGYYKVKAVLDGSTPSTST